MAKDARDIYVRSLSSPKLAAHGHEGDGAANSSEMGNIGME